MPEKRNRKFMWTDEDRKILERNKKKTPKTIYKETEAFQVVPFGTFRSFYNRWASDNKLEDNPIHSAETARGEVFFAINDIPLRIFLFLTKIVLFLLLILCVVSKKIKKALYEK